MILPSSFLRMRYNAAFFGGSHSSIGNGSPNEIPSRRISSDSLSIPVEPRCKSQHTLTIVLFRHSIVPRSVRRVRVSRVPALRVSFQGPESVFLLPASRSSRAVAFDLHVDFLHPCS